LKLVARRALLSSPKPNACTRSCLLLFLLGERRVFHRQAGEYPAGHHLRETALAKHTHVGFERDG